MGQLSWEPLLHSHDLFVGAADGRELALVDIGAEVRNLCKCVHDGSGDGEVRLCWRHKNDQVIRNKIK
jgi:hypothetical protein